MWEREPTRPDLQSRQLRQAREDEARERAMIQFRRASLPWPIRVVAGWIDVFCDAVKRD